MSEATQSIEVDYDLPQPPAKVWRALTEPALLSRWLVVVVRRNNPAVPNGGRVK